MLTDFGVARAVWDSSLTRSGFQPGSPAYMAPEQARGREVGRCTDVYALGVVLYEMVSGRRPFRADNAAALMYQHVHERPVPPGRFRSDLPRKAEAAILRAMAKDPGARFSSVGGFAKTFQAAVGGRRVRERQVPTPSRSNGSAADPGFIVGLSMLVGLFIIGGGALALSGVSGGARRLPTSTPAAASPSPGMTSTAPMSATPETGLMDEESLSAPKLLRPSGAVIYLGQAVKLGWGGVDLPPDHRYRLDIQRKPGDEPVSLDNGGLMTETVWEGSSNQLGLGEYRWRVSVVEEDEGEWDVHSHTEWRLFTVAPYPTAVPTPKPTETLTPFPSPTQRPIETSERGRRQDDNGDEGSLDSEPTIAAPDR
jgi:hypothetical protein